MKNKNQKYLEAFGKHLNGLLALKSKTPEEVAAIGNIETKQVYRVMNAEHDTSLSIIIAIAKGLEIHPKDLFNFE